MPALFDCSLRLDLPAEGLLELHFELGAFLRRAPGLAAVLDSELRPEADGERVDLRLAASNVREARRLAGEVLEALEAFAAERLGSSAVRGREVIVRAAPELDPEALEAARLDPEAPFCERVLAGVREARRAPAADPEAALWRAETARPGGTTAEVVGRYRAWNEAGALSLLDAGHRHLTLRFLQPPSDPEALAVELLAFCPNLADEIDELDGMADAPSASRVRFAVHGLVARFEKLQSLHLYWD